MTAPVTHPLPALIFKVAEIEARGYGDLTQADWLLVLIYLREYEKVLGAEVAAEIDKRVRECGR